MLVRINPLDGSSLRHGLKKIIVRSFLEGNEVVIEVSDTGTGIPQEHLDQIFNPFFTMKEVGKGTGLGLSISYNIIQDQKGQLSVESEIGDGNNRLKMEQFYQNKITIF